MGTAIASMGHFLPPMVEHHGALRPIAIEPIGPSTLAARATEAALARAGWSAADIDFIVFATTTPDVTFPGAGVFLQHQLGCGTIGVLDVRAQCAGFLYGLAIADPFLRSGAYERILLAGGEVHSAGLDPSDAGATTARLFGDGAGVALLERAERSALLGIDIHADGRHHREFWCEHPASRQFPTRITEDDIRAGKHFPKLDLEALRAAGPSAIARSVHAAVAQADIRLVDIDHFIVSHVLPEVAEQALADLGVEAPRATIPARRFGHIMAGALPIALSEHIDAGTLAPGARVCLATAGAGFAWGAAVIQL